MNIYAPAMTLGPDKLLQDHVRHSQEKLNNFLQYVADQGALRDGQVSNMSRDVSYLRRSMDEMAIDLTALRATNTMVVQSMNMLVENRRLRETIKELIGRLDSSK